MTYAAHQCIPSLHLPGIMHPRRLTKFSRMCARLMSEEFMLMPPCKGIIPCAVFLFFAPIKRPLITQANKDHGHGPHTCWVTYQSDWGAHRAQLILGCVCLVMALPRMVYSSNLPELSVPCPCYHHMGPMRQRWFVVRSTTSWWCSWVPDIAHLSSKVPLGSQRGTVHVAKRVCWCSACLTLLQQWQLNAVF